MSLTRDNDSMQQKFQSIRSIWRSQLNTLREETAAIRTVLKRQYGMSDDLQTGGDTKRLRREHERTMEMQERLDEISSELAATTQQLEEERKLRSAAKDGHKQVQEQLDTIRDMLNPRQRENMKGILTRSRSNAHLDASILSDQSEEDVENEVPRTRSGGKRRTGRSDYRDVRPVLSPLSPTGGNDGHNKNADSFHESFMSPLSPGDYVSPTAPPSSTGLTKEVPPPPYVSNSVHRKRNADRQSPTRDTEVAEGMAAGLQASTRARRHFMKQTKDNFKHTCRKCFEKISFRTKHCQCTQCHLRYHVECEAGVPADCRPAPFSSRGGANREVPPLGSNLEASLDVYSADDDAEVLIPGIVHDCISALDRRALPTKGLYRRNGNSAKVASLLTDYFLYPASTQGAGGGGGVSKCRPNLQVVLDVNDIAGVFKKFLSDLDEPVTSYTLYSDFIDIAAGAARHAPHRTNTRLCKTLADLPTTYFYTLRHVIEHLQRVAKEPANSMSGDNLARVFGPTLLRSPEGSLKDLEHAAAQIDVVKLLLALPVEYWDTAEEAVAEADVATSASPLPDNRKVGKKNAANYMKRMA
eukprot:m.457251 g.457251  ORF g.457251 m.457251 type:complete len:584 (-) comp21576_c0_seq29:1879-3630(-)